MSKIPQGAWNAIAARYENGESISNIARSYGCTPPAIHYILKRNRRLPAEAVRQPTERRQAAAAAAAPAPDPTAAPRQPAGKFDRTAPAPALVRASVPVPAATPQQPAGKPDHIAPAAPAPGLDSELHHRAEAAIEIFRTSFDAALMEGSPGVRERLRQAASDLMRVAARTTIVLDRLNAGAERSARAQNYPRSAHTRDEAGNFGPG